MVEAYELVERELIDEGDFRDFVFGNPARFWTGLNPDFFAGTAIENEVSAVATGGRSESQSGAAGH